MSRPLSERSAHFAAVGTPFFPNVHSPAGVLVGILRNSFLPGFLDLAVCLQCMQTVAACARRGEGLVSG